MLDCYWQLNLQILLHNSMLLAGAQAAAARGARQSKQAQAAESIGPWANPGADRPDLASSQVSEPPCALQIGLCQWRYHLRRTLPCSAERAHCEVLHTAVFHVMVVFRGSICLSAVPATAHNVEQPPLLYANKAYISSAASAVTACVLLPVQHVPPC